MKYCIYCGDVAEDHSCPSQIHQDKQEQYCTSTDGFDFKPKPKIRKLFKYPSVTKLVSKYRTLKIIGFVVLAYFLISLITSSGVTKLQDTKAKASPSADQQSIITKAGFSDLGAALFINADGQIENKVAYKASCTDSKSNQSQDTIELGCYDAVNEKISLLEITNSEITDYVYVAAAHETLHSAYSKLTDQERVRVDTLTDAQLVPAELQERLRLYPTEERVAELHSFLGSEFGDLSPELETYYNQFFTNRKIVIAASDRVKAVYMSKENQLSQMKSQLDIYDSQINNIKNQHLGYYDEYDYAAVQEYNYWVKLNNDSVSRFNNLLPSYNILVGEYNALNESLKLDSTAYKRQSEH